MMPDHRAAVLRDTARHLGSHVATLAAQAARAPAGSPAHARLAKARAALVRVQSRAVPAADAGPKVHRRPAPVGHVRPLTRAASAAA